MIKISPSALACDLTKMGEEVNEIEKAGAEMVHLDVMDGVFVPNSSFGLAVLEALRKKSSMFFDVHLMIDKPEKYIERYITECGADLVTFHLEATDVPDECLETIKKYGKKAAVSVKPKTPAEAVFPYLDRCDMVLVMTVEPGFGGQSFMPDMLDKVRAIRAEINRRGLDIDIQVDGGINSETAKLAREAGANVFVAGSAVFKAADRKAAIDALR
ncbi:MAG: ribulose-phosphate 3-epimerase [Ruminococcaceae bacterium]|nr:ribulose-phosphate 3-epimerase [Oscillospiraceae bacterium]